MRHLAVVGGVALVSGVVVASAIYRRRAALRSRLSRWTEALELVKAFGDSSGLEAELSPGHSPLRNFALTSAVQALTDRRAAAAAQLGSAHAAALSPASLREASRYMRFASAAYGAALMALFGLLPPPTREQLELSVEEADRAGICTHTGIRTEDLLRLDTASLDVAGSSDCLRHFLAVDSAGGGAVVLALRGTASLSDVVHDAVAYSEPFCGGEAHAGMARMARAVWAAAGGDVRRALGARPGAELVITGHSLGAGVACLLAVLLAKEEEALAARVRCFAFAPPPVFAPLSAARGVEVRAFLHGEDCVPFLSVDAGRRLLASLRAAGTIADAHSALAVSRVVFGRCAPSADLVAAVSRAARGVDLPRVERAPRLLIPASSVVWVRQACGKSAGGGGGGSGGGGGGGGAGAAGSYDAVACDPASLATAGIGLSARMLADHMTAPYEAALDALNEGR